MRYLQASRQPLQELRGVDARSPGELCRAHTTCLVENVLETSEVGGGRPPEPDEQQ